MSKFDLSKEAIITGLDILGMSAQDACDAWDTADYKHQVVVPDDNNTLQGVVKNYTCEGEYGPDAVMRAVMALTGWLGMMQNYSGRVNHAFCGYIGTSHVIGLRGNTWLVEVYDCGWQVLMLHLTAEGFWQVRFLTRLEDSCKPVGDDLRIPTKADFEALGITPLLMPEETLEDVGTHLVSACLAVFGVHYLNRLDGNVTSWWMPHGMNADIRKDNNALKVFLQPYGETMPGKNIVRVEIRKQNDRWYCCTEGAWEVEQARLADAFDKEFADT